MPRSRARVPIAKKSATRSSVAMLETPPTERVARLVSEQSPPPAWLVRYFGNWAPSLRIDRLIHTQQPTRRKMREWLLRFRDSALELDRGLDDGPLREFLTLSPFGDIQYHGALQPMLRDLVARADHALARPLLSAADGKAGRGAGPALPPGAVKPKVFCAALIAEARIYLLSDQRLSVDRDLREAAETYWRECGGKTTGTPEDAFDGWRYHFGQINKPAVLNLRTEIRRHLVEGKFAAGN